MFLKQPHCVLDSGLYVSVVPLSVEVVPDIIVLMSVVT